MLHAPSRTPSLRSLSKILCNLGFVQCVHLGRWFFATRRRIYTEQRWTCHKHIARFDQLGEVTEKQSQQQDLNVRAVNVSVTQDTNLAVAQSRQIGRIVGAVRIDTNGHRDIVNFVVGKQTIAIDFPGIEHLAAQRQNGLAFFVAAHLGATARRVALDQKHFVVRNVFAFAIGQLAGQHSHARALALLYFLACLLTVLRRLDGQLGQFFAVLDMFIEPQAPWWVGQS